MGAQSIFFLFNTPLFLIVAVAYPLLVGFLVKKIGKFNVKFSVLLFVTVLVAFFSFLSSLVWRTFVFNNIYYEWDSAFQISTPLTYERPLVEGTTYFQKSLNGRLKGPAGTWLAQGWSQFDLYLLWLIIFSIIYLIILIIGRLLFKDRNDKKFIFYFCIVLFVISFVIGFFPEWPELLLTIFF